MNNAIAKHNIEPSCGVPKCMQNVYIVFFKKYVQCQINNTPQITSKLNVEIQYNHGKIMVQNSFI